MNFTGHVINAVPPHADMYESGPIESDVIDAQGGGVLFIIQQGIGTTGTTTATVVASLDQADPPGTSAAIPFIYRVCSSGDTWGAWTAATTAGFETTAGSNNMFQIWADPSEVAEEGYRYVALIMTEATDAVVIGGVLAIVLDPRYAPSPSLID